MDYIADMKWLDYVILVTSCIAELYICYDFFSVFFSKRDSVNSKGRLGVIFVAFVIFLSMINLIGYATLNLLVIPLLIFVYLLITFKAKLVQIFMYFILVMSILVGCEYVFAILAEVTKQYSGLILSSMPWLTFAVKLLSFIILLIIKQFSNSARKQLTNSFFWMYLSIPIASLGMMFATYFISLNTIDYVHVKLALSFCFFFMLLGNIIVFTMFNRYAENLYQHMQQNWIISKEQMNKQYYEKIADMNDKRQEVVHNFKHYITALKALIQTNENKEAIEILNKLNNSLDDNELSLYSQIPFLDIILSEKKSYAEKHNVKLIAYVEPGSNFGDIKKLDYAVMLGNLLDNAIQAATNYRTDSYVNINIFMENNGSFLVSKISNNFNRDNLTVHGKEFVTTKKEEGVHGIGIKSVKSTAESCGGTFATSIKGDKFTAILVLPIRQSDQPKV